MTREELESKFPMVRDPNYVARYGFGGEITLSEVKNYKTLEECYFDFIDNMLYYAEKGIMPDGDECFDEWFDSEDMYIVNDSNGSFLGYADTFDLEDSDE